MGSFCFRHIPTHSAGKMLTNSAEIPVWATDLLHNNLSFYSSSSVQIWTHLQSHKKTIFTHLRPHVKCQTVSCWLPAASRDLVLCFRFLCRSGVSRRAAGSLSGRMGQGSVRWEAAGRSLDRCSGRMDMFAACRWWDTVTWGPQVDRCSSGSCLQHPDETLPGRSTLTLPEKTRDSTVNQGLEVGF